MWCFLVYILEVCAWVCMFIWGNIGSLEGKRNGCLCMYLLFISVVNWRTVYLSEVQVRRIDLLYFF